MRTKQDIKEKNKFRTELEKEYRAIIEDAIQPNSVDQADIDWELDYELEDPLWDTQDDIENGDSYYEDLTNDYYEDFDNSYYDDDWDTYNDINEYYPTDTELNQPGCYYVDKTTDKHYFCCEIDYRIYYVNTITGKKFEGNLWNLKRV